MLGHLSSELRFSAIVCAAAAVGCLVGIAFVSVPGKLTLGIAGMFYSLTAVGIVRLWRVAPWLNLAGGMVFSVWGGYLLTTAGFTWARVLMVAAGPFHLWETFSIRREIASARLRRDTPDLFELPEEHQPRLEALIEAYEAAFGISRWDHYIISRSIWLHPKADYVIMFPPTELRNTWLYGTLLISTLSDQPMELIVERPKEDNMGAVKTLCVLIDYLLQGNKFDAFHTAGGAAYFGDESEVRGLLFCDPPDGYARTLRVNGEEVRLLYMAGITKEQLLEAQRQDDEGPGNPGARRLHEQLQIAECGIARLPN